MEFLYLLTGLIALLLGTDTATKGLSGALQQAGLKPLSAGLVLVAVGYALPGLAVLLGALAWSDRWPAVAAAHGAVLGTLGIGAAGLLLSTGLVLRVRPWAMLGDDKARAELAEFAASREGWGRNLFRLALGFALLIAGARGVLAGAPMFAALLEGAVGIDPASALTPSITIAAAIGIGGTVAVVSTFNARFGDAAAAFAAIIGGGALLLVISVAFSFVRVGAPPFALLGLAHPLLHGAVLFTVLAVIAKPGKPIGRGAGLIVLAVTLALLVAQVWIAK